MLSRLYSLHRCALHTIISGCDLQSLEVRCTISALCYRYKLHYYPLPAIVQALLPAAKATLLADLLTREQLDASVKPSFQPEPAVPRFYRNNLLRSFPYCMSYPWNNLPPGIFGHAPRCSGLQTFKLKTYNHPLNGQVGLGQ